MATAGGFATDICLFLPPFAPVDFPQLGTAVLKTACQRRGLSTRLVYGNLMLAGRIGLDLYQAVDGRMMRNMVAELLFRDHAYPAEIAAILSEPERIDHDFDAEYAAVAAEIAPAIEAMVDEILALRPRILGLSSTFQQNMACSAIALRVKARAPDICIVMGGANAAWPICLGLARSFPWVDHFFAGESDIDFPDFCERLIRGGEGPRERVIRSAPINDMRIVAPPDFSDYFATLRPLQAAGALPEWLPRYLTAESSRGCWWGAKSHCTFCGLNGDDGMAFRHKPAERVCEEFDALAAWGVPPIYMTDNIMPRQYLTDLLPRLAEAGKRFQIFYEVKSNMSQSEVDIMARGGVRMIQPGIESLASGPLRLMRKGVSAHQNIALLRDCGGVGIMVAWGIIYGFPGEAARDYAAMADLMPLLAHLQPPNAMHRIVIDRFSPLYRDNIASGIGALSTFENYRALYPPWIDPKDVAYHFTGDYSTELTGDPALLARLEGRIAEWRAGWASKPVPVLQRFDREGGAIILDTRPCARRPMTRLSQAQNDALAALERPRSWGTIDPATHADVEWLVEQGFAIDYEDKLVSIVVQPRSVTAAAGDAPDFAVQPQMV
ncbi:RiPP maturation radical SAM C-methyltransferase [Sphingomonas sp. LB-2]|uniref:RiPP maturation radical SAM C-methyltransferase n=1 Tax=Sphingomonas caeni TaxID=2984949 RepID=UPI0022320DCE|nr:RiPP maturation radical SAM C-methyltransferase [Sphingomonas caeni]MCW3846659.1 RiPP maturation radical SAM C-methyltransferase [Sphingomonas caeni]